MAEVCRDGRNNRDAKLRSHCRGLQPESLRNGGSTLPNMLLSVQPIPAVVTLWIFNRQLQTEKNSNNNTEYRKQNTELQ